MGVHKGDDMNKFGKILGIIILSFAGLLLVTSLIIVIISGIRMGRIPNPGRINLARGIGPIGLLIGAFTFFNSLLLAGVGSVTFFLARLNEPKSTPPELPVPTRKK